MKKLRVTHQSLLEEIVLLDMRMHSIACGKQGRDGG